MASHRAYSDIFVPAAAGIMSWSKARVSATANLINGQQPRGY
jgi:hypothetical protein